MNKVVTYLLSGVSLLAGQMVVGQSLAHGTLLTRNTSLLTQTPAAPQTLQQSLQQLEIRYRVSILADAQLLEGKTVESRPTGKLDDVLRSILTPYGLSYEKIDGRTYVIVTKEGNRRKALLAPQVEPGSPAKTPQSNGEPLSQLENGNPTSSNPIVQEAQDQIIMGRVTSERNEGLPGVSVVVKGTQRGTTTDGEGRYRLTVPETSGVTLVFSFVGYVSQEVALGNRSTLDLKMIPDDKTLSEVVVVGYGTQKKSDLTGAVAQVKGDEIKKLNVTNIQNALQGQAAGVYVSQSNGAPGAGADVTIRGQTSVTGLNQVLYVVDGIPITGSLNNINPQDIESIEVLKDASAAAIYGSRASSGVVLVTTKRGKSGAPKVSFDAFYGWQSVSKKIPLMNAQQWAEIQEEAVSNTLARNPNAGVTHNPFVWDAAANRVRTGIADSTDWHDAYYRVAPTQNYYLSFSGGGEKSKIYVGAGYQNQQGIALNSYFQRYSLRLNSDHTLLSGRVRIGNNLSLSYSSQRGSIQNYDFFGGVGTVLRMSPLVAVYKQPGTYSRAADRFAGPTSIQYYGQVNNPVREAELNNQKNRTYNVVGSLFADIELAKGLTFHTEWGGEIQVDDDKNFVLAYREYINFNEANQLNRTYGNQYQLQARNFLTYKKTIAKNHDLTILAGTDFQDFHQENFFTSRQNFANQEDENLWYLGLGTASTAVNNESASEWAILSYYGRLNYTFQDRYLFTATLRRDGSSRFAGGNQWGNFPSFSAGWRISQEKFFPANLFISDLKLRGGWGRLGNERSAGNYVTSSLIGRGVVGGLDIGYVFGSDQAYNQGARPLRIPNADLTWEISEQSNIGVDIGLWNNRVTMTADYFVKNTRDMILNQPLPNAGRGALDPPQINIGTLRNRGFEFELAYAKKTGPLTFNLGLNLTTTRGNQVTYLAPGVNFLDGGTYRNGQGGVLSRTEAGRQIAQFFLYEVEGIFKSQEEITNHAKQTGAGIGDYKFKDANGDKVIDGNDRVFYGNPWPLFVGGLKGNFGYKNLDLSLFFQGSYGNDILNTANWWLRNSGPGDPFNFHVNFLDRYHPVNNPDGKYAAPTITDPNFNRRINSTYVEDGSYLRLQNVQLGYTLPARTLTKISISNLRFYAGVSNLFTLTKYSGYNPDLGVREVLQKGVDRVVYPIARTYTVGLNLVF